MAIGAHGRIFIARLKRRSMDAIQGAFIMAFMALGALGVILKIIFPLAGRRDRLVGIGIALVAIDAVQRLPRILVAMHRIVEGVSVDGQRQDIAIVKGQRQVW